MHHGPNPFENFDEGPEYRRRRERLSALLSSAADFRGALGEHPEGMIAKDDEGSIQFAIGDRNGKVVIDFGTPIHWLGMSPQQAADFASAVLKHARKVGRKNGQSVGFTIS